VGSVSRETCVLCGSLLGIFLVSLIAFPEVLASLTYKDQMRRIASTVLSSWYWTLLIVLTCLLILVVLGAVVPSQGTSIEPQKALFQDVFRTVWKRVSPWIFASFLSGTVVFVAYFGILLQRVSSPERVIQYFARRASLELRRSRRKYFLRKLETLINIGKEARGGYEKGLIIGELDALSKQLYTENWDRMRVEALSCLISGLEEVVQDPNTPGDDLNALRSIEALGRLYVRTEKVWGKCDFDYGRFAQAVLQVTLFSIRKGYTNAATRGVGLLSRSGRFEIHLGAQSFAPPDRIATCLEQVGLAYLSVGNQIGALSVVAHLVQMAGMKTSGNDTANLDPCTAALALALALGARIAEEYPDVMNILKRIYVGQDRLDGVLPQALEYLEELRPTYVGITEMFAKKLNT